MLKPLLPFMCRVGQPKVGGDIFMMISAPPTQLRSGPVRLQFDKKVPAEPGGERVPFYHFKILNEDDVIVGHINFRVGDTRHIRMCAGHIGYNILLRYRGSRFSYHACKALAPFIRQHYDRVIITADPSNLPSLSIIEKLGAVFIDEIEVPEDDPAYADGARKKRRFEWSP